MDRTEEKNDPHKQTIGSQHTNEKTETAYKESIHEGPKVKVGSSDRNRNNEALNHHSNVTNDQRFSSIHSILPNEANMLIEPND